jgi:hypothetical protein
MYLTPVEKMAELKKVAWKKTVWLKESRQESVWVDWTH